MNFKVGDKVRILTVKELMKKNIPVNLAGNKWGYDFLVNDYTIIHPMTEMMGRICTVRNIDSGCISLQSEKNSPCYFFPFCMVEPVGCVTVSPAISFDSLFSEVMYDEIPTR